MSFRNILVKSLALVSIISLNSNIYANVADPYLSAVSAIFNTAKNEAASTTSPNTYPLSNFTMQLPKGGDLHNHFTGAVYPWQLINYAKNDLTAPAWCIKKTSPEKSIYKVTIDNNCILDGGSLLSTVSTDKPLYKSLLKSWSMYEFILTPPLYGHDHFFSVFGEESALTDYTHYRAQMLADLMRQAYNEHINYLELMVKPDEPSSASSSDAFAKQYLTSFPKNPSPSDIDTAISTLIAHNFTKKVVDNNIITAITNLKSSAYGLLHCNTPLAESACNVSVRFQYEAIRTSPLNVTFANLYAGFMVTKGGSNFEIESLHFAPMPKISLGVL